MDETQDFDLNDLKDIRDDQERLHFQLSSLWENGKFDTQKVRKQFHELKLLQLSLYFFITSGIVAFFILVFMNIHFIIILIDVGVVVVYLIYLKYITHKYRKILKISKKNYKLFIKRKKKTETFSILELIFYSFLIILTILILILPMIGINPLILIIIIGVSLLYVYFDTDIEDDNTNFQKKLKNLKSIK